MEIGSWSLEYDIEPITIEDIDLAIRFNKNEVKTYNDLYKKFVRINSTLKKINKKTYFSIILSTFVDNLVDKLGGFL